MLVLQHHPLKSLTVAVVFTAPFLVAQSPAFEVASIRRCEAAPTNRSSGLHISPGRLTVACSPLKFLIQSAYAPSPDASIPISGGPAWLDSALYDIEAKADNNPSREAMSGPMLQALLEERFRLRIHWETKEIPVYDLTVAKSGPKLQAFKEGSCASTDQPQPTADASAKHPAPCGSFSIGMKGTNLALDVHKRDMTEFSRQLHLDRPVIDKTGIAGLFDFHLEFAIDGATAGFFPPGFPVPAPSDSPEGPSIFTAVQQQLGLKLDPAKGPGAFLIIDSVERPSEN
jgi:uncharacterized protein (TIGR03435 family)